jgi:hypothetical protein
VKRGASCVQQTFGDVCAWGKENAMAKTKRIKEIRIACSVLVTLCLPISAAAELLSQIQVQQEDGVGVIHIFLTRPVVLTSFFPEKQGYMLHIYFNDVAAAAGAQSSMSRGSGHSMSSQMIEESMNSPPTDLVPTFWVKYGSHGMSDPALDPKHLMIQFAHEVKFKVQQDRDNRGFYIFILDGNPPARDNPSAPSPSKQPPEPTDVMPAKPDPN